MNMDDFMEMMDCQIRANASERTAEAGRTNADTRPRYLDVIYEWHLIQILHQ